MLESRPKRKERRISGQISGQTSGPAKSRWRWPLVCLAVLACGLLLAGGLTVYRAQPSHTSQHDDLAGIGKAFARHEIPREIQTFFSPDEETHVEPQGGNKYLIQGWVDLIRPQSRVERQNFSCVVYKNSSGDWVGEQLVLIAQM